MKNTKKSELRLKAEKILSEKDIKNSSFSKEKVETLIEELNIYQIELEHQNDELKKTQIELENTNAQYTDLYHQAPVGYFTVDKNNKIINVNQKGADLFGQNINSLLNTQFTKYIHPDSQDIYYHHHRKVLKEQKPDFCEIKITTKSDNPVYFRLESIPTQASKINEMAIRTAIIDITSEKKLEEENYRRLHILENISDSVIVTDLHGEITFWNQGAERIFGYSTKEMLRKNPSVLYPEMNQEKLDYDLEKIKGGEDYIGEWKGRNKNGETVWLNIRTSALFDKQNNLIGYLGVAKDITELKQTELYKSQLASIVEYSEDGIESMDIEGNILSWNLGAEKIYGYKASEIIGKNARKLYTDELKNELRQNLQKVQEGKPVSNLITKRKRKNGDVIDVAITFSPIKNTDDQLIGISVVTRDITEQTKVRNKLKESELRYQTIFEESGNAILVMTKDKIISCNKTLTTLFGYTKDEIMGKSPIYFSPEYQFEDTTSKNLGTKYIKEAYEKGYVSFEWKHLNKKGDIIYTHISLKKIKIEGKDYLISILHDLTEIRNYQHKLKERSEEILAQNEEYRSLNEELHMRNEQLELSEEKFRVAFETSPDAIAINRLSDGLYLNINMGFTRLTAYAESDVKNKTSAGINIWVNPEDRQSLLKELEENGYVTNFEAQFKRKDGALLSGLMSATIIEINNEKCILSITRDITEKKTAEEQIKELNFRMSLANESAQIGIWDFYIEENKIIWDDNMYKLYGLDPHEFDECYEAWQNALHPEDRARAFKESEDAIKGKKEFHTSFRVLWPDKTVRYLQAHAKVILDKTGKAIRMTGVNWDITDVVKRQKDLRVKDIAIQSSLSAIVLTDLKGDIFFVNKAYLKLWGYKNEKDILGRNINKLGIIEGFDKKVFENIKKGVFLNTETKAIKSDGSVFHANISANLIQDKKGNPLCLMASFVDITERKKVENRNTNLAAMVDIAPNAISVLDFDGNFLFTNERNLQLHGYTQEEFYKLNLKDIDIPESAALINSRKNEIETNGEASFEVKHKRKDGSILPLMIYVKKVDWYGKPAMLSIGTDITERKKAEHEINKQKHLFESMFHTIEEGVVITDTKRNILLANQGMKKTFGYQPEQLIGKNTELLYDKKEEYKIAGKKLYNKEADATKIQYLTYYRDQKNRKFPGETFGTKLYDNEGKWIGNIGIIRDVSERMQFIEELKKAKKSAEERQKYSKIIAELSKKVIQPELSVEEIGDLIYEQALNLTSSGYGYVATIDHETEDLVCHTMKEMMPDLCNVKEQRIAFPKGKDGYMALYGHALNTQKSFFTNNPEAHEASTGLPKGHVPMSNFLTVPVVVKNILLGQIALANKPTPYDSADLEKIEDLANIYGMAVYRKQMEEDLISSKEKAEESDRLKSAFLANMSHEIRTPMNAIRGFSQLMVEVDFPKEKQQKFLEIINTRTQDLLVIIDDIIDISKIEANQLNIVEEEFSLNGMLTEIYNDKKPDFKTNEDLEFKLDLDLDSEPNTTSIFADKGRLKQVFINLINNAKKFTSEGSISFGYKINKSNELVFYVKDTGIGIPKDSQNLIFERFRQVDGSSTRKYGGTGLGLNICKQILSLMEGDIWVESESGKGSIFYFSIPYKPAKKENNKSIKNKTFEWSNKNVLIVEDDDVNLYYLCELLEPTKVKIYKAHDRNETMEHLQNNKEIDLILLDINLPEVDGNEVVKEIRQTNKDIPVIAQSAYSMGNEIEDSMKYGFNDYVTKPIDSKLLFSVMNKHLSKRKK